jgi:ubiquinone/menaquinone biosynthesis C-methylase UbiE
MNTPPICNYEGSDYQKSFWDKGERDYEDAVEAAALKKLLPTEGNLLLELGAGAGRNTSRYQNYKQIVLVDYSISQLQQAQQRLGVSERYRYVAADIYNLPFVNGLFDTATMIRTLHHMADARRALNQVRQVLNNNAVFILEFANKQNLKAILRYLLRRQSWNPFTPEPIEFAPLNFDFHPTTIRSWLQMSGFTVEKQLSVSHFRMRFIKKIIPLKVLVSLDSLFQSTGSLWQFTPSMFVRSHTNGDATPIKQDSFFRCPACGCTPLADTPPHILCPICNRIYPVEDNIYNFRLS